MLRRVFGRLPALNVQRHLVSYTMHTELPNSEFLEIEKTGNGVLHVKLNRPSNLNAMNAAMMDDLTATIHHTNESKDILAVVLSGSGRFFSAGIDFTQIRAFKKEFMDGCDQTGDSYHEAWSVGRFMWAVLHAHKPIIAAVNGPAVGIGFTLLLHCDRIFAVRSSSYSEDSGAWGWTPFMRAGLAPEFCSSYIMPRFYGKDVANDMLLASKKKTAEELLRWGIYHELSSCPNENEKLALQYAQNLTSQISHHELAEVSLRQYKAMMKRPIITHLEHTFHDEMRVLKERFAAGVVEKSVERLVSKDASPPEFNRLPTIHSRYLDYVP